MGDGNDQEDGIRATRSGVQSLEQGLRVARVFADADGPLPLKDVARISGLGPSATHRYLVSLVRANLVIQREDGRYDLGPLALRLGFAGLTRIDAVEIATAQLRRFVEISDATGMLSVWSERGPVVIRWIQGIRPVFTTIAVGSVMPLDASATGRVFQAFARVAPVPERMSRGLMRPSRLMASAQMAKVREAGFATAEGDLVPGLYAVAVPVFDGSDTLVAVMTAVAAGSPLSATQASHLQRAAEAASRSLGHRALSRKAEGE